MISNRTFWALKRREQERAAAGVRPRRAGVLVRRARPGDRTEHTDVIPHAEPEVASDEAQAVLAADIEDSNEPTYRELQQRAIALGISGRQTREELERAIEAANE